MTNGSALIVPAQSAPTNAAQVQFQDFVKPPIEIFSWWTVFWWAVAIAVIAAIVFWIWRRSKRVFTIAPPPPLPPHVRARRKLEDALGLISEAKPFSTLVSDTLRVYLEERFDFRAPERTTEEFLYELQSTDLLTPQQKESLAEFLRGCDLVKFAKYEPTEVELRALHASALRLVNETEPSPIAPELGSNQSAIRNPAPSPSRCKRPTVPTQSAIK